MVAFNGIILKVLQNAACLRRKDAVKVIEAFDLVHSSELHYNLVMNGSLPAH